MLEAGIFATLDRVDESRASRSVRPKGPSIADHAEHLRWSLVQVRRTLEGHPWKADWPANWSVQRVEENEWRGLRRTLREEVEAGRRQASQDGPKSDGVSTTPRNTSAAKSPCRRRAS